MQLRTLLADENAVSPVIGVILMVAITVILAAVIGTFVLGLGDQVSNTSPSASFNFEYESGGTGNCGALDDGGNNAVEISHSSGDEIPADQLTISDGSNSASWNDCASPSVSDVTAGNTVDVEIDADDEVRILWQKDDDSATLSLWNGPDA